MSSLGKRSFCPQFAARHNPWQENVMHGLPNRWHYRSGGRYLHICEDGLVHYCSQQRSRPAIPLERYRASVWLLTSLFPPSRPARRGRFLRKMTLRILGVAS